MKAIVRGQRGRILGNYARLFGGLLIGLLVTRLLLGAGQNVFAVYTLITVGIGVSIMLTELLRLGFVPELGPHVFDGKVINKEAFQTTMAAAFQIAGVFAVLGAVLMLALGWWLLPDSGTADFNKAAMIFLALRIAMMMIVVMATPCMSIFLVAGRQGQYNLVLFFERFAELVGVGAAIWVFNHSAHDEARLLIMIGSIVSGLTALAYVMGCIAALSIGPEFKPNFAGVHSAARRSVLYHLAWNSLHVLAMNLYARSDVLIVASFLEVSDTVALGVALRLMGYIRQGTTGLVNGLDATFANIQGHRKRSATVDASEDGGSQIISMSSALQASVIFPTAAIMILAGPEIIGLWIGDALSNSSSGLSVEIVAQLSSLMVIGIGIRSLTLGWMSVMTGSGMAHKFTPWLVPGSFINIFVLIGWAYVSPQTFTILVVGWTFLVLQAITHGFLLPAISSRALNIPLYRLFLPFIAPAIFTGVSLVLYLVWDSVAGQTTDTLRIFVIAVLFSIASAASLLFSLFRNSSQ